MMSSIWVVLLLALTGSQCGYGLPVRPTPQDYPHDGTALEGWASEGGVYAAIPALALVLTALVLVFGCTWCYRHKDCKIFTASAQQLHSAAAQRVQPPDSGFSEPANNNISEDNNNGPISLREMQNIANNNAAAYIVSENEERNRISRESVVEFEPLPAAIVGADPLERCADWFGEEDFPRNNLQYLREIGRGWFGRVVEGEIEEAGASATVAVRILNQNATLEDKARFLDEAKMYRDVTHENILTFIGKCLQEDPWILIFELCTMDLQEYLLVNRPKMAALNETGVPLQLMCDVSSALAYLHSRDITYGRLYGGSVLVRGGEGEARAVLGRYSDAEPQYDCAAPEVRQGALYTTSSEIWSLGTLIWEVCSWGSVPTGRPSPPPDLPCPYKSHLYQVMQLCWNSDPNARPTAAQVHALISHLHATHSAERAQPQDHTHFEERWQRLKPNSIPKLDEHVAIVHAPSNSRFNDFDHNTLGIGASGAISRSSSIMSDRDPLASHVKSESLTNLHGSLDDVRNIYLTHNETAALESHQGNIQLEDSTDKDQDRSDASMDPWLKDIIAGSQDDVSYYKDVSDVIKNLDNILNSEKTSSSESSHQASPSRDNLSLDCKKEYPLQSCLVKSPGITNFQNILDTGFATNSENGEPLEYEVDRDTIGTLSHSFERHSDSTSQHTLANLTPDTPMKDLEVFIDTERQATDSEISEIKSSAVPEIEKEEKAIVVTKIESNIDIERLATNAEISEIESQIKTSEVPEIEKEEEAIVITKIETKPAERNVELPEKVIKRNVPELKELCVASMPSVSDNKKSPRKDCQTPCDNVTENKTKSIDDVREVATDSMPLEVIEVTDSFDNKEQTDVQEIVLPVSADETTISNEVFDTLPSVTEDVSITTQENDTSLVKIEDIGPESMESEYNYSKDETILVSDIVDTVTDSSKDEHHQNRDEGMKFDVIVDIEHITAKQMPVSVQNITVQDQETTDLKQSQIVDSKIIEYLEVTPIALPPETVQNTNKDAPVTETDNLVRKEAVKEKIEFVDNKDSEVNKMPRSDSLVVDIKEQSEDSAECMDLINNTNSQILNDSTLGNSVKEVELKQNSGIETLPVDDSALSKNDSTQYLDLPSFDMMKKTSEFLQMEIEKARKYQKLVSSTPLGSDNSADLFDSLEVVADETLVLANTETQCVPGTSVPDTISPFESPSHKSHHTDTYEENSSVVLGTFENTEIFKGAKPFIEPVELPREELLAFSSNFGEINLETPSPLRDMNFLNEVPDITPDVERIDDVATTSVQKVEAPSEDTESGGTQRRVSPSTPPNSPGTLTSQERIIEIDLSEENAEHDSSIRSIDLNQIELQITSKLAMAENENNLNIEYSGPLTVEGLIEEGGSIPESDAVPEYYLAGNGGSLEDVRELLSLDEDCVKALRNELELKLPLAQVATIEPADEVAVEAELDIEPVVEEPAPEAGEGWGAELPPPPEVVVNYLTALSPIMEETAPQLSAYENDTNWNPSTRTDSSESYPEPCNNSTDSATSIPRGDTYTVPSKGTPNRNLTDVCPGSSREITMSADSLNGPCKSHSQPDDPLSPIDDRTYTKRENESNCERISQVSPYLVSPTTDTDLGDIATRVSTLSRTTLPTDAKHSKPTDTCLSKATSIDSWCSNDTLYNLEENFDDLVMDAELVPSGDVNEEGNSESTDTLTHNDDDKEISQNAPYIIHDCRSEPCETFSPDSIAALNLTHTYNKPEAVVTTDNDIEDSKNTQTKDLAYGSLMSGLPSFSNCSIEAGAEEGWRLPQPELLRKSPVPDLDLSPPKPNEQNTDEDKKCDETTSLEHLDRHLSQMGSVDISCLRDELTDGPHRSDIEHENRAVNDDSPNYRDMAPSLTSTPIVEPIVDTDDAVAIPLVLPLTEAGSSENFGSLPNFETFVESIEVRPHGFDSKETFHQESGGLLEDENTTKSLNSNEDNMAATEYRHPRDMSSLPHAQHSSQSMESNVIEGFHIFEDSVRNRPQDLSTLKEASSRLLYCERMVADITPLTQDLNSNEDNITAPEHGQPRDMSSLSYTQHSNQSMESNVTKDFCIFEDSVRNRPQDLSTLKEASSRLLYCERMLGDISSLTQDLNSNGDNTAALELRHSRDMNSDPPVQHSSQNIESNVTEEFRIFEDSVRNRPQDLSISKEATSRLPYCERMLGDISPLTLVHTALSNAELTQSLHVSDISNLMESHQLVDTKEPTNTFLINLDLEDETEQPHSIIVTEVPSSSTRISPSKSYDSHLEVNLLDLNNTYNSHDGKGDILVHKQDNSNPEEIGIDNPTSSTRKSPSKSHDSHMEANLLDVNTYNSHDGNGDILVQKEINSNTNVAGKDSPTNSTKVNHNKPHDLYMEANLLDTSNTYNSHSDRGKDLEDEQLNSDIHKINGDLQEQPESFLILEKSSKTEDTTILDYNITTPERDEIEKVLSINSNNEPKLQTHTDFLNGTSEPTESEDQDVSKKVHLNGGSEKFATVNFLNEPFEELIESSVDDSDSKDDKLIIDESPPFLESTDLASDVEAKPHETSEDSTKNARIQPNGVIDAERKITTVTEDFLQNEKKFATLDSYLPLLSDIRFTGPASEMMSTSFQDSPTSPDSPECEQDSKPDAVAEILKEWDSDSDSHTSNSSSGEFIWKDCDGRETAVVPSTHFDHQRGSHGPAPGGNEGPGGDGAGSGASEGSGDSGSGSEGDEVEFVPSSWDCRAAPAKSSLRSLEQATPESKKRVVFKRQKYHCVYEYPREAADVPHSPAYLPDLSTYCEWDPSSAEEAELCYGQLFSSGSALGAHYQLRAGSGAPFGTDYDEDFFISSSARPFESLGIMSTTSQFFPGGMSGKRALLERSLSDEGDFPAPPSPPVTTFAPSLDFTTPDSGVEDITPGSTLEDDFEPKKVESEPSWRPLDSGSSSESVSPSSPGGELGGLRHTRDRLKLDLPPSPHAPSPRQARVFNFTLAPPKRRDGSATPLVMTDETPVARDALPVTEDDAAPLPEPTFSTFGKSAPRAEPEQKLILTDESGEGPSEATKCEGTVVDSGDEDSGIESSSKATLERNVPNVS